jgi:hypothetical protein
MLEGFAPTIRDWANDQHTLAGKKLGRDRRVDMCDGWCPILSKTIAQEIRRAPSPTTIPPFCFRRATRISSRHDGACA